MQENRISMVILAGGKSSRMGTNKADLMYQGKTFLQHQIQKGKDLAISDIWISGYHGNGIPNEINSVQDRYKEKGPLGGLESAFRKSENKWCLVLGIDIVLIPVNELQKLIDYAMKSDAKAVIMEHNGRQEPLIGIYQTCLADEMLHEILVYKGSVFAFLRRMRYDVYITDCPDEVFMNINTPDIYQTLLK